MGYIVKTKGKELTFDQVCEQFNIPAEVLKWRLTKGWTNQQLLRTPTKLVRFKGKSWTFQMLAEHSGLSKDMIIRRYDNGLRGDDLIKDPDFVLGKKSEIDNGQVAEEVTRARMAADCQEHLHRLRFYHPERDPARRPKQSDLPSAAGRINAGRLISASSPGVRQYSRM